MANSISSIVKIEGFENLQKIIKKIGDDKTKRREVLKILGQVANPTKKAAQQFVPIGGFHKVRKELYLRKKRQVNKVVVEDSYTPGMGRKSIGKKVMRRAKNPMLVVRANDIAIGGKKKYGGFYLRQFVLPGTKHQAANPFMEKAYKSTAGMVSRSVEKRVARYLQKQIDRLT